jgi:lipopolysaccharide export LptBFGC system permease protein LptF
MIVSRGVQKFGSVFDIPPWLTIAVPILLLGVAAVLILRRSV